MNGICNCEKLEINARVRHADLGLSNLAVGVSKYAIQVVVVPHRQVERPHAVYFL